MRLAFYRGTSLISRFIRWQTRGRYSHVGVLLDNGSIYESWHIGGVLLNRTISRVHEPGTKVDVYEIPGLTIEQRQRVVDFLHDKCGRRYDFVSVARFISRREKDYDANKWFCSELVMAAFEDAGMPLLKIEPHKVSPEVLSWSPALKFDETLTTTTN